MSERTERLSAGVNAGVNATPERRVGDKFAVWSGLHERPAREALCFAVGMGGKHKASKAAKKRAGNTPVARPGDSSGGTGGPSRVLLLRHGQSEANATRRDMPDPPLTELGRVQATAWKGAIGRFGAEAVLVSPLRRALETALLAYDRVDVPVEVCRHARELWWDEQANTPSTPEALEAVLRDLPRGDEVRHALGRSCTPWLPR